jgi:uncharacterized protein
MTDTREAYMKKTDVVAAVLLVIGGLNWGLVGALEFDLVAALFGPLSPLSRVVYILVGLAALYQALQWKAIQHRWALATR